MTAVSVTTASTEIAPAAKSRKFVAIYNNGSATIFLAFDGTSAATTAAGFPLAAGESLILSNQGGAPFVSAIYGIVASGSEEARVQQAG